MQLGVTVVDMGGGTTSIAVFREGQAVYTAVLPIGGQHVTTDIARGLSTPLANAERMKTLYGHALAVQVDDRSVIEVPQVGEEEDGQPQQVARSLLTGIIQPRLEETFELVRSQLEISGMHRIAGRRVVLTGGACQLPGVRDLAALILDKQVRTGRPVRALGLAEATGGPAFATCAGLLAYGQAADQARARAPSPQAQEPSGLAGRVGQWVREHF
jgi:cell division protein FtsA